MRVYHEGEERGLGKVRSGIRTLSATGECKIGILTCIELE